MHSVAIELIKSSLKALQVLLNIGPDFLALCAFEVCKDSFLAIEVEHWGS